MSVNQRHTERARAKRDAIAILDKLVEQATVPGWYGQLPLALDVQDGVVQLVRDKGAERTYPVGRGQAAA